jgi:hypothetical protein
MLTGNVLLTSYVQDIVFSCQRNIKKYYVKSEFKTIYDYEFGIFYDKL